MKIELSKELEDEHERRVSFLSKMTGTPRQEVDRVINRINQILKERGEDVILDANDISHYAQVKYERVVALMAVVSEINANMAQYEPYINKAKWR